MYKIVTMNDTIFGKIIRGELPATKVYEDEQFLAFLDINPITKGHILLIPKDQYTWIHEVPNELLAQSFIKAKELIIAMRAGLPCDYVQVGVVGNEVPHFHIHLIPRTFSETVSQTNRPHVPYENSDEMNSFAEKIRSAI
jgi:histidine triad (HIT) family protein